MTTRRMQSVQIYLTSGHGMEYSLDLSNDFDTIHRWDADFVEVLWKDNDGAYTTHSDRIPIRLIERIEIASYDEAAEEAPEHGPASLDAEHHSGTLDLTGETTIG